MNRILLIVCFWLSGLFVMQAKEFVFTPIDVSHGLSDNQIRYILQLPDGRMVFVTSGNVNLYDGARFTYIHQTSEHFYALDKYDGHHRIYQEHDSLLWIKNGYTLACIDLRKGKYITDLERYLRERGITEKIDNLFLDSSQRLWMLSSQGLRQEGDTACFDLSAESGELQDMDAVDDRLYLFYNTGELVCYHLETKERLYSCAAYPEEEQISFSRTSLIVKGEEGFFQLRNGGNGRKGGFFYFDIKKQAWQKLFERDYTLNTLIVTSDEAYVSSRRGIDLYDLRSGQQEFFPIFRTVTGEVLRTEISTIFSDEQGGLWTGTFNRGLLYYHPSRYKFIQVGRIAFTDTSLAEEISVRAFAEDETGTIYLRSQAKYYQYNPDEEAVLKPVTIEKLPVIVRSDLNRHVEQPVFREKRYTSLCTDVRGWTWGGTPDGLRLFRPEGRDTVFYTENGLSNNFVHAILEDRHHHIWVTTSYGISRIEVDSVSQKIHFLNFNPNDGTLKEEYTNGAIWEASDGTIYFGGIEGFNVLNPDNLVISHVPSQPLFSGLLLHGEIVRPGVPYGGRVILSEATPYTKAIELSYNQNFLAFEFAALNYQNPAQTHYRFRLVGMNSDWHEASVSRQNKDSEIDGVLRIPYTNLSPGKYLLQVMFSDNGHQWDGDVTELAILIHAPWWKTTTAYIVYSLILLIVILSIIWLYIHTTRKKIERQHKEEILLHRIRSLIEQTQQYEAGLKSGLAENAHAQPNDAEEKGNSSPNEKHDAADVSFLTRAMEQVEKNLDVAGYSVEQLSKDLCMDRTGLYRKLITLLDESPSIFIRNIRLRRAAQLILEGELSITEISERVGFNSHSYMSKCFMEMYGCRPSEYAAKTKNQHKF
ncbi:helix-turn-helix domain-containing protein [Parabacteroides sp. OttesenSCG-928-B22]|nr:helix-turn-helix domain-containing protein [Parabacteroides sp. OttesenSCG-928-B22]